jgi:hypothetical protein
MGEKFPLTLADWIPKKKHYTLHLPRSGIPTKSLEPLGFGERVVDVV